MAGAKRPTLEELAAWRAQAESGTSEERTQAVFRLADAIKRRMNIEQVEAILDRTFVQETKLDRFTVLHFTFEGGEDAGTRISIFCMKDTPRKVEEVSVARIKKKS